MTKSKAASAGTEAKTVKYKGESREVIKTYPFNDRTYYMLKGVPHAVSERVIEK